MTIEEAEVAAKSEEESYREEMKLLMGNADDDTPVDDDAGESIDKDDSDNEIGTEATDDGEANEATDEHKGESRDDLLQRIDKLQRALDTTNGTYGSQLKTLQGQIQALMQQRQQPDESVKQDKEEIQPKKFEKLREQYPELADLLAEDLGDVSKQELPDLSVVQTELERKLDEERQARIEESRQRELKALQREHPDFNDVASYGVNENGLIQWNNPAFGNWVASQAKEVQNEIINGDDAFVLSNHISAYKQSLGNESAPKKSNMSKAVQPKTTSARRTGISLDPEDEGFAEEMKRLRQGI